MRRTHPYTLQENGKVEIWWQTLERSKTQPLCEPYLSQLINEYNHKWVHKGVVTEIIFHNPFYRSYANQRF